MTTREQEYWQLSKERLQQDSFNDNAELIQREKDFFNIKEDDPYLFDLFTQHPLDTLPHYNKQQQLNFLNDLMEHYYFQLFIGVEDDHSYEIGLRLFNMNRRVKTVRRVHWDEFIHIYLPYLCEMFNFYNKELHRPEVSIVACAQSRTLLINYIQTLTKEELGSFVVQYNRYFNHFNDQLPLTEVNDNRVVKTLDKYTGYINAKLGQPILKSDLNKVIYTLTRQYQGIIQQVRGPRLRAKEYRNYVNRHDIPNTVQKSVPISKK